MPDQLTKERIDQEVVSANKDRLYQATKKEVDDHELKATAQRVRDSSSHITNQELQISHHNHQLESKINPTLKDYINVKHKSLFEKLKGLFR